MHLECVYGVSKVNRLRAKACNHAEEAKLSLMNGGVEGEGAREEENG